MTIRITNECDQYCLHCMQESGPKELGNMTLDTFKNTLEFINRTKTKVINISGGEATLHPDILTFLKIALSYKKKVVLLTNGLTLMKNPRLRHDIFCLMLKDDNLLMQITSVRNVYSNYISKTKFQDEFKKLLIFKKIKNRVIIENTISNKIVPVGRALVNVDKFKEDDLRLTSISPRCFNLYNTLQHQIGDLIATINYVKENSTTSLCIPLITENGDILFGEHGNVCSKVWNVNNDNKYPVLHFQNVNGPCGGCYINETQKQNCEKHLVMYNNMHNKIEKSYLYKKTLAKNLTN